MSVEASSSSRHLVAYADGEIIFSQGDQGDEMYIVEDGRVEILLVEAGGDLVSIGILERGDFFGEMAVLESVPRTATVRSKGGCRLLPLRGSMLTAMLQRNPETALRIMRKLCGRIRELQRRLAEMPDSEEPVVDEKAPASLQPAPARSKLAARLIHTSGVVFELPSVAEALVGRPDPSVGRRPEIDLTTLNQARSISRCHARIANRDGRLFVIEETGATNGVSVNDERLESGESREIRSGDRITFGSVTLELAID